MEANTNANQLEEIQLREMNSLQEQVNELQAQLDELKDIKELKFPAKKRGQKNLELSKKSCTTEFMLKKKTLEKTCWTFVIHHLMRNEATTCFSTLCVSLKKISEAGYMK